MPLGTGQSRSLYQAVMAERQQRYNAAIASGQHTPFVYPWDAYPGLILLLSLLFTPRLPRPYDRIASIVIAGINAYLCFETCRRVKTLDFAGGYGTGLMCAWGMIMTVSLTLVNDPGKDFQRIERLEVRTEKEKEDTRPDKVANGSVTTSIHVPNDASGLTTREVGSPNNSLLPRTTDQKPAALSYKFVWQGHPTSIAHRLDWCFDLMTSFRGPNWNWRISSMPPIDVPLPENKIKTASRTSSTPSATSPRSIHLLQRRAIIDFILHYILLDALKTTMITDPYFLGIAPLTSPTPWPWLANLNTTVPIATRLTRLALSLTGVFSALSFIFSLSPLFFTVLLPTLTNPAHLTRAPLLEPWMYPPYNAPLTRVLDSGLPAFWSAFWHQLFRFGISSPAEPLISALHIRPKSPAARILQVGTAFTLSGIIHASASYTAFPPTTQPTRPIPGPLAFFLLQGIGVLAQSMFARLFSAHVADVRAWPRALRRTLNGLTVLLWLWVSGPLLANDFARCGIWLFEPVPISLFRGLGFGDGNGWFCWGVMPGERWLGWWTDERWWRSGIAIF